MYNKKSIPKTSSHPTILQKLCQNNVKTHFPRLLIILDVNFSTRQKGGEIGPRDPKGSYLLVKVFWVGVPRSKNQEKKMIYFLGKKIQKFFQVLPILGYRLFCLFWRLVAPREASKWSGGSVNIGQAGKASVSIVWPSQTIPYCWPTRKKIHNLMRKWNGKKISHPFLGHLIVAHQGPLKCESRRPKRSQFFGGYSFFSRITQGFIDAKLSGFGKALDFPSFLLAQKKI